MPQIMAEAFAKGLVDKIMIEVLDLVDGHTQNGKSWEQDVVGETNDIQVEFADGRSRVQNHTYVNYSKNEDIELITKVVRDLRDIQIGDSHYVLSPSLSLLENQVKCAACNVNASASLVNSVAETGTTQGQGDTHQVVHHTAVLESSPESSEQAETLAKGSKVAGEAVGVVLDLLHQMLEMLEYQTGRVRYRDTRSDTPAGKEHIATWEEKEEQIIRTIENSLGNMCELAAHTLRSDEVTARDFHDVELKRDELRSCASQHAVSPAPADNCLLERMLTEKHDSNSLSSPNLSHNNAVMTLEEILSIEDATKTRRMLNGTLGKKKRGFAGRLRKLFRAVFRRRKD